LKVDIEDVSSCKKILKIEIPTEDVNAEFKKAYDEIRNTVPVRGFRKGKAPLGVLRARFAEYVKNDVVDKLVEPAFEKAVEDAELHVLRAPDATQDMSPSIDELTAAEDEPLSFEVTVNVKPEIILPDMEKLEVDKGDVNVTQEDVDKHLEALREERADFIPMEDRPLQKGDYATLSIKGTSDDEVLVDQNEQVFNINDNMPVPDFAEHLIGMEPGDEKEFSITFPEAAAEEEKTDDVEAPESPIPDRLAGKEIKFEVTLHKITERHLPDLDDDFAKDLDAENVEQLNATVWNQLVEFAKWQQREAQQSELVDQLLEKSQFEVPEFLVEEHVKVIRSYIEKEGNTLGEEELAEHRLSALNTIKRIWILDEIARSEEISVEDAEVEAEVAQLARSRDRDPQKYMKLIEDAGRLDGIKESIMNRKIFDILIEKASEKRRLII